MQNGLLLGYLRIEFLGQLTKPDRVEKVRVTKSLYAQIKVETAAKMSIFRN